MDFQMPPDEQIKAVFRNEALKDLVSLISSSSWNAGLFFQANEETEVRKEDAHKVK